MKSKIFINKVSNNIESSVLEGLKWVGFDKIISKNARVSIKTNYTYPHYKEGVTTSTPVVEALIKNLKTLTNNISIVESNGGRNAWAVEEAFSGHNLDGFEKKYGIKLVNLSKKEWDWVEFEKDGMMYKVPTSAYLTKETDVFITMPVPKIHAMTGVTLSLKNQWGCVPDVERLKYHYLFDYAICAINKKLNPQIIVGDATYMLDVSGPMYGEVRKEDLLIVSNDAGYFELACCKLMGINPDNISHLRIAKKTGIMKDVLENVEFNKNIEIFSLKKFTLKRTIRKWVVLAAFKSKFLTWFIYGPSVGKFLHAILYFIKKPDHLKDDSEE